MLESIWKKILRRRGVSLWSIPAAVLWVLSLGFGIATKVRSTKPKDQVRVSVPVISVGNIAVGGSGKTPLVKLLTQLLLQRGLRVGIVSSGFGRSIDMPLVEEGRAIFARSADETGDEPKMLAGEFPDVQFAIHPSKTQGARLLVERGQVDVMIVDDGFQHTGLHRDLDLVAFDAAVPPRRLRLFPYGVLREPVKSLSRADLIVITRADFSKDISSLKADVRRRAPQSEIYSARFNAGELVGRNRRKPVKYLDDKSVLLFAGVGHFDSLRRQVQAMSGALVATVELADHHRYDHNTFEHIERVVDRVNPDVILTTAKDWVKAGNFDFGREFYYLTLQVDLDPGEEHLAALVMARLGLANGES